MVTLFKMSNFLSTFILKQINDNHMTDFFPKVYKEILNHIKDNCFGCRFDCPSQRDHECLLVEEEEYSEYFYKAIKKLYIEGHISIAEYDFYYNGYEYYLKRRVSQLKDL